MVSHLNKDSSANPVKPLKVCSLSKPTANTLPSAIGQNHTLGAKEESRIPSEAVDQMTARSDYSKPQDTMKDGIQMDGRYNLDIFIANVFHLC